MKRWTNEEVKDLERLIKDGRGIDYLVSYFGRSSDSISKKVYSLGLKISRKYRHWTDSEVKRFKRDWYDGSISMNKLMLRYNRTELALKDKASRLGLSVRPYDDEYLSVLDICNEMGVSEDRVLHWLRVGLNYRVSKSGRVKYLISQEDLLDFLRDNPDRYDASKISEYLFVDEPDWLIQKRKDDYVFCTSKSHVEYTNEEDIKIERLFKQGKSDKEIAKEMRRSESALKKHREILGYSRKRYNLYEIEILKKNSRYLTVDELLELLPLRDKKSIKYKCNDLGIPYHTRKSRCESR